jgi:hypothetical protein
MAVGDRVESYEIGSVAKIEFGSAPAPPAELPDASRERVPILRPERPISPAPVPSTTTAGNEVPAGTVVVVRMIDDVDSERDRVGQTFRASLDEPVMIDGRELIPRGVDVSAKLVDDQQSGRLTGRTELTMDLVSITAGGKTYDIATGEVTTASESRTGRTAKVVGGTAALGAIIGAIAGGGKGAAIGAAGGAAAGGAVQILTKGQKVKIPAETRLSFTLQQPVRL